MRQEFTASELEEQQPVKNNYYVKGVNDNSGLLSVFQDSTVADLVRAAVVGRACAEARALRHCCDAP
jgi:hypothetical protein